AEVLGYLEGKKLVGLAMRDFGQWKTLYSAAAPIPATVLVRLMKAAGIEVPAQPLHSAQRTDERD
ncbi:MAG: hypothetical protein H5T86_02820, partial [Armatimonadetes bacterium]|nr:hypothetical protein [Armatimonadota bacterium]